jgi:hypothetical protein
VAAAAPTQPPAQPAGRQLLSEHVRGATRSAVLCGETGQRADPHQPSPRSMEPQTECMSGAGLLPTESVLGEQAVAAPPSPSTPPTEALQPGAGCSAGKASLWALMRKPQLAGWRWSHERNTQRWGTGAGHGTASCDEEMAVEQEGAVALAHTAQGAATNAGRQSLPFPMLKCCGCQRWHHVPEEVFRTVRYHPLEHTQHPSTVRGRLYRMC